MCSLMMFMQGKKENIRVVDLGPRTTGTETRGPQSEVGGPQNNLGPLTGSLGPSGPAVKHSDVSGDRAGLEQPFHVQNMYSSSPWMP